MGGLQPTGAEHWSPQNSWWKEESRAFPQSQKEERGDWVDPKAAIMADMDTPIHFSAGGKTKQMVAEERKVTPKG